MYVDRTIGLWSPVWCRVVYKYLYIHYTIVPRYGNLYARVFSYVSIPIAKLPNRDLTGDYKPIYRCVFLLHLLLI